MNAESRDTQSCLNCGARLGGQYCGQCGQRATDRLISLWELTRDAFGDLFELDSRLWRTLIPLLIRPGALTRDYLQGRRARYMPPFRMYLVLSLLFFVIAFFDPRQELGIFYEASTAEEPADAAPPQPVRDEDAREILEELVREGVLDPSVLGTVQPPAVDEAAAETAPTDDEELVRAGEPDPSVLGTEQPPADDESAADTAPTDDDAGFNITIDENSAECDLRFVNWDSAPQYIQRRFTEERLEEVCRRVKAAGASGVIAALLDRVPVALLILLPIMAFVLKLLYPLSRRYYVEHLLFVVHFNAFLFLLLTLQILWSRLIHVTGLPGAISIVPIVATSFYVPVYLYKSLRRVYEQGHVLTTTKFFTLSVTYSIGFAMMMLASLLITVFSI